MNKMTKIFTMLVMAFFVISVSAFADEVKILSNPTCGNCKTKIESGLNKMPGVENSNVDVDSKIVTVNYDPSATNPDNIMKEVKNLGFTASLYNADAQTSTNVKKKCCSETKAKSSCKTKCEHKSGKSCNHNKNNNK